LIVSTPNRLYYTESRGTQGANPFHVHEFEFDEFTQELRQFFSHVSMYLENHIEGVTFQPPGSGHTVETRVDAAESVPYSAAGEYFYIREVPSSLLGGNSLRVDFHLDKAIAPSSADARELGIVVVSIGLESKI
jgi:hypothetical protein